MTELLYCNKVRAAGAAQICTLFSGRERLNAEAVRIAQSPEFRDRMKKDASIAVGSSGPEFAAYFRDELQKWSKTIKVSGASAN